MVVFAPTDDAFAKLPLDVLHAVQDLELLTTVLTYHVVPALMVAVSLEPLETVAGIELTVSRMPTPPT